MKFKILETDHQSAGIIQMWGVLLSSRQDVGAEDYVTDPSGGYNEI